MRSVSARCSAAYVYTAAGIGESSTDLAWDGEAMIYEAGDRLAIGERFQEGAHITIADVDLERLRTERKRQNSFTDNAQRYFAGDERMAPQEVEFTLDPPRTDLGLERAVNRFPFVPNDPTRLEQDCYEAYNIQVAGLVQRLRAIGNPKIVIGVSGGLDSTHALVVAAHAMDLLPSAHGHPVLHASRFRHFRAHEEERDPAVPVPGHVLRGDRHPPGGHTDVGGHRPPLRRG